MLIKLFNLKNIFIRTAISVGCTLFLWDTPLGFTPSKNGKVGLPPNKF